MPRECPPTVRASSGTCFHYAEYWQINVWEATSFPIDYEFGGDLVSQYKQVGNAVPIGLSTVVALSVRQVLKYEYDYVIDDANWEKSIKPNGALDVC